jgi:hypothetical protein
MHTVIADSEDTSVETGTIAAADTSATLTTTLYDLIAAVQDVVGPQNEALVVATVQHLLRSGRATWGRAVVASGRRRPHPRRGRRMPLAVSA